jgi:G3E family GTPase
VEKLAKENRFDYLLIESTGISEPVPVAQTFSFTDEANGVDLSRFAYIDTMVTVVDALNFAKDFGSVETLQDRRLSEDTNDHRTIVNLLTDQIEFADVIIVNKADLVKPNQLAELQAVLKRLNPGARIVSSRFGQVPPTTILNTGLFDYDKASQSAGWIAELERGTHTPETDEYGISSFVFRDRRPFHPERFWTYVNEHWPANIIRSKGLFWLASRPDQALNWGQAGGSLRAEGAGVWWASMAFAERIRYASFVENQKTIESRWDRQFGDRMNELVFIGQDLESGIIAEELEMCLCTPEEIAFMQIGGKFNDAWPI